MIKNATFTSVWDKCYKVTSNCKVNMTTKEVFDIEHTEIEGLSVLEYKYITIDNVTYPVFLNNKNEGFWYEY